MFLHRIHLDPRCREVRRDLADPYQLHSTLSRAFCAPDRKISEGEILWRLEPEADSSGCPRILIQSRSLPDWARINVKGWLVKVDPAIDISARYKPSLLKGGQRFRYRLRANPCVTRDGKRLGLLKLEEQEKWLERKGERHGFSLPKLSFDFFECSREKIDVQISEAQILRGRQHSGNVIKIFAVLYEGMLKVTDPEKMATTLKTGIGHGKAMGLGLLSLAPID